VGRPLLALVAVATVIGVPVYTHHSFAAHYFEDRSVSIEGELSEFEYVSPHAWVYVMAADESGQVQRYSAEWANPSRLTRAGITKDTLKPGDRVIVTGSPGRRPEERKVHLKRIERPSDGWKWGGQQTSPAYSPR
jgi:Family of unknown function (DUF6152)